MILSPERVSFDRVTELVWLGSRIGSLDDFRRLRAEGIRACVDMKLEGADPWAFDAFLWLPTADHEPPSQTHLRLGLAFLRECEAAGMPVFVVCHGRRRAAPRRSSSRTCWPARFREEGMRRGAAVPRLAPPGRPSRTRSRSRRPASPPSPSSTRGEPASRPRPTAAGGRRRFAGWSGTALARGAVGPCDGSGRGSGAGRARPGPASALRPRRVGYQGNGGHAMVRVDGNGNGNGLVRVRGLDKKYQRGGEEIHVLQGLNLDVDAGEFVAFMGPSGSGKTTLLNLLGGLDVPSAGTITVAGDEITHMSRRQADRLARAPRRLHLPDLQPHSRPDRLPKRRAAAAPDAALRAERREHVETALRIVGLAGPHAPLPAPALGRAGAAGRASRAPSSPTRRSCSATSPPATSTAGAPTRSWTCSGCWSASGRRPILHGHPRPARRRARERAPAPRQGRARGGGASGSERGPRRGGAA